MSCLFHINVQQASLGCACCLSIVCLAWSSSQDEGHSLDIIGSDSFCVELLLDLAGIPHHRVINEFVYWKYEKEESMLSLIIRAVSVPSSSLRRNIPQVVNVCVVQRGCQGRWN